jgi:putative ABC transport system permease protein
MVSGVVDYGALEFYGLRPLAGRFFDHEHGQDGRLVAEEAVGNPAIVINETAMHNLGFSSPAEAIGKIVNWNRRRWSAAPMPGTIGPSEIIGVAPDVALDTRRVEWPQILYVDPASFSVLSVRLNGPQIPEALTGIDAAWSQIMHSTIHRRFLSQRLQDLYADVILQGRAISLGAALAGMIAALGLFGMAAHSAERRTKEVGIRKAMGASSPAVVRLMLGEFGQPLLWAILIAWPAAYLILHRWLQGFTYRIELGPWMFLAVTAIALLIALVTVMGHALRVARARPIAALRYE